MNDTNDVSEEIYRYEKFSHIIADLYKKKAELEITFSEMHKKHYDSMLQIEHEIDLAIREFDAWREKWRNCGDG